MESKQVKLSENDIFKFIDLYFKNTNIVYQHQYNSFNKLIVPSMSSDM